MLTLLLRQEVCDAFNLLKNAGKLHPEMLYKMLDDRPAELPRKVLRKNPHLRYLTDREAFFLSMRPYLDPPDGYKRALDYVFLWRQGSAEQPYLDAQLIEAREFIAAAAQLRYGKTAWS